MDHDNPGIRTRIAVFYDRLALVGAMAFLVLLAAIPLFGLGLFAIDVATHLDTPLVRVVAVALAMGVGILAFRIRVMHRALYGVIEIALAIVISWFTFADVAPKSPGLIAGSFIGAVYFVVRGLDNATHDRTDLDCFFFGVRK